MNEIVSVFGINWGLLLVQAVNFGLVLLILWRYLYRPVVRMISERQKLIEKGVTDARTAEEEKNAIQSEKDAILARAAAEGDTVLNKATLHAKEKGVEIVEGARLQGESILKDAESKAEEMKRKALDESKADIARMAVLAAEKILREKTS